LPQLPATYGFIEYMAELLSRFALEEYIE